MDWFPLYNSIRIALIATVITFFLGIFLAYYVAKLPRMIKGVLDCILTLPLVLPPTVIGFFILKSIGKNGSVGKMLMQLFNTKITMTWYASVIAVIIVTFPLMYRTVRSSFEAFDKNLIYAGKTLGLSNTFIFWKIFNQNSIILNNFTDIILSHFFVFKFSFADDFGVLIYGSNKFLIFSEQTLYVHNISTTIFNSVKLKHNHFDELVLEM